MIYDARTFIQELKKDKEFNADALAEAIGFSTNTLYRFMNGTNINEDNLNRLLSWYFRVKVNSEKTSQHKQPEKDADMRFVVDININVNAR